MVPFIKKEAKDHYYHIILVKVAVKNVIIPKKSQQKN